MVAAAIPANAALGRGEELLGQKQSPPPRCTDRRVHSVPGASAALNEREGLKPKPLNPILSPPHTHTAVEPQRHPPAPS